MEEIQLIEDIEDIAFPIATIPSFSQPTKPAENPAAIKKIIRGAVQAAYQKKSATDYDAKYHRDKMPYISKEEVEFVTHLIESLQPADTIEAALAVNLPLAISGALKQSQGQYEKKCLGSLSDLGMKS